MNTYQIVYRDEGRQQKLHGPDVCARLFRPHMTADGFKRWAREHNCPPQGGVMVNGALEPAWCLANVRLRRVYARSRARKRRRIGSR